MMLNYVIEIGSAILTGLWAWIELFKKTKNKQTRIWRLGEGVHVPKCPMDMLAEYGKSDAHMKALWSLPWSTPLTVFWIYFKWVLDPTQGCTLSQILIITFMDKIECNWGGSLVRWPQYNISAFCRNCSIRVQSAYLQKNKAVVECMTSKKQGNIQ